MAQLYDEVVPIETTPAGRPAALLWRGDRYRVERILKVWDAEGVRVYRLAVRSTAGPAITELALGGTGWRLRRIWR